ncbi:F-box domain, FBD domain, Leucine-rich repeat domain, L domain-like protein [Artemisia annua]|uniref:F-box domain, FBD domain, Leucine-rich repeat domain, L domain-like protein n=1 Tax=Artemisia annua TaxID=35608 RepID=A0A2U1KS43_ARTAN|nr:F-box domain, FBD domain, Leucine-rich repeat domain, L domain-like protein [Artemisia annua]
MTRPKRTKPPKHKNGVDFISNMPDVVLLLILQGLSTTEEIVRTSILSTRWRYLWTSIPFIDLDVSRGPKNPTKPQKKRFKEFVSRVLENQTLDLNSFRLRCLNYYMPVTIWRWVNTAVTRKAKKIDLMFCTRENHVIKWPQCLVTCDSLESLRLDLYPRSFLVFPDCMSFPALKVLELNNIIAKLDMVEKFTKNYPLLEELCLIDCFNTYRNLGEILSISCSKLKTLRIHQLNNDFYGRGITNLGLKVACHDLELLECVGIEFKEHFILENVNSLKKAVILPRDKFYWNEKSKLVDTIPKVLVGISHVESLSLNSFIIWLMDAAPGLIRDFPASFPNLKKLEITTTICAYTLNVIIRIIRCSPILESLHLIVQKALEENTLNYGWEKESYGPEYWALDEVETREILTRHLKRVEFLEFDGLKQKLVIARCLLKYANALEELVFSWRNEEMYHAMSTDTMNQVSKFYKAYPTVKLITLLKY